MKNLDREYDDIVAAIVERTGYPPQEVLGMSRVFACLRSIEQFGLEEFEKYTKELKDE